MKGKKINFDKLIKEITEVQKDPEFIEAANEFIRYHTGKSPR